MVPEHDVEPTPVGTATTLIRLGNLHQGVDSGEFLLVFIIALAVFVALLHVLARVRQAG